MPVVKPFRAVRPSRDKVHLVATRSYVSYTIPQLRKKLHENPFSYLHIIHPDISKNKLHKLDIGSRFQRVKEKYRQFMSDGILERDHHPSFYLYRQTKNNHSFIGIVCAVSIDDYLGGRVKIHEQTLSRREEIFTGYLDATDINAEPVLLISEPSVKLQDIYSKYQRVRAEYDFTQVTRVRHEMWCISDADDVSAIESVFASQQSLYIADGHHRCASSAALCKKRRMAEPPNPGAPWNYFLAYIIDESNVKIYAFNRLVKDLNGLTAEEFLDRLRENFTLSKTNLPHESTDVLMYLSHQWYTLTTGGSAPLDAQAVSDIILQPVLGIEDLRNDRRVSFMEEPRGLEAMKHAIDRNHFAVGFALRPVSVHILKEVADQKGTMPPKSTWIEPKLRSGMVIYELGDDAGI